MAVSINWGVLFVGVFSLVSLIRSGIWSYSSLKPYRRSNRHLRLTEKIRFGDN